LDFKLFYFLQFYIIAQIAQNNFTKISKIATNLQKAIYFTEHLDQLIQQKVAKDNIKISIKFCISKL